MVVARSDYEPELYTKAYQSLFFHIFDTTPAGDWQQFCTMTQSNNSVEKYFGIGSVPKLSEFTDERKVLGLGPKFSYEISNKKYEATIAVRRDDIEDDQYGMIEAKIRQLATETKNFYNELVFSHLATGQTTTGFDGKAMFATDHEAFDSGVDQSNYFASKPITKANLQEITTAMKRYKDEKGRYLNITPTHIIVSPEKEYDVRELLNAQSYLATGLASTSAATVIPQANAFKGALNVIVTPYLDDVETYYIADLSKAIKPIIFQNRVNPEFYALDQPTNNEAAFMRDYFYYGIRLRCGLGFGPWFYMAKCRTDAS